MNYLLWIASYIVLVILVLKWPAKVSSGNGYYFTSTNLKKENKLRAISIVAISLLFVLLNVICTKTSVAFGSDRENYNFEFLGYRSSSIGLDAVFYVVRSFTNNFYFMLNLTTFICSVVTLIAFTKSQDRSNLTLLFLLSTDFIFFSFTALKQSFACAFGTLFFALLLKPKSISRNVVCLFLILIASLFHPSSIILLPIFLVLNKEKIGRKTIIIYMVVMVAILIGFEKIGLFLASITASVMPSVSHLLYRYFVTASANDTSSLFVFLKGVPFYFLLFTGLIKRNTFEKDIPNYDKYLIILATASAFYISSLYIYWASRFRAFFYLPAGVFLSLIYKKMHGMEKIILIVMTLGINAFLLIRWIYLIGVNYGGF